jgi:hypothetical protein
MEIGPSTVRADTPADELAARLQKRDAKTAIVTTPKGACSLSCDEASWRRPPFDCARSARRAREISLGA